MQDAAVEVPLVWKVMYDPALQTREFALVYVEVAVKPTAEDVATVTFIARSRLPAIDVVGAADDVVPAYHWKVERPLLVSPNIVVRPEQNTPASNT